MEYTSSNLFDLNLSKFLLDTLPEARETKAKMNYCYLINIKSFCTAKETVNKTKRQLMGWEKIFTNGRRCWIKGWYPKSIKNFIKSIMNFSKVNKQIIRLRTGKKT